MASRFKNITVDIGADYVANVVAYANGSITTPTVLTNYTANAHIKPSLYHANATHSFNVWIQDASAGIINLHLNRANTLTMSATNYVYDVMVYDVATDKKTRILEGVITAKPGVSR